MLKPDVRAFLASPHVARLSVVDSSGYPHTVPLWYAVDGDDIVMISVRNTRKVDFVRANPKASICIGGGEGAGTEIAAGYLLKGDCRAEEDDDRGQDGDEASAHGSSQGMSTYSRSRPPGYQ